MQVVMRSCSHCAKINVKMQPRPLKFKPSIQVASLRKWVWDLKKFSAKRECERVEYSREKNSAKLFIMAM